MKKNFAIICEELHENPGLYGVAVNEKTFKKFKKGTSWGQAFEFEWMDLAGLFIPVGIPLILGKKEYGHLTK